MKKAIPILILFCLLNIGYVACSQHFVPATRSVANRSSGGGGTNSPTPTPTPAPVGNVSKIPITVGCGYLNEPCVSVTICEPGTSTCQTIHNILLDTGSYGLRLFSSVVKLSLPHVTDTSNQTFAECVTYVDGASESGPIATADIHLGEEKAANIPIQLIDATYAGIPSGCTSPDTSPGAVGFNGIIGVGQLVQDCGSFCTTNAANNLYYSCSGSSCSPTKVPLGNQVRNPVASLPNNNNGVILQMPAVATPSATSSAGYLIFGIGTDDGNTFANLKTFPADEYSEFTTTYGGQSYNQSFIDSGSNGLSFPSSSAVAKCDANGNYSSWYCPPTPANLSAVMIGTDGTQETINFTVYSADSIFGGSNVASANLAGPMDGAVDWGFPFFFGRTIAIGIEGSTSNLGSGGYWAF